MIEIFDDFLDRKESRFVLEYCKNSSYTYGEVDTPQTPPTGMVHKISNKEDICQLFDYKIRESCSHVKELNLYRIYVNCFAPCENPYFHNDEPSKLTFLYYANDEWTLNDGGETQIIVNKNELKGILPIPNRMIGFDSTLLHRATSFRYKHRFTLAVKFQ
tara:strand:+ start:269 stop:748 length:480 start_codon:yes stop_codon:yes gene_type:complete